MEKLTKEQHKAQMDEMSSFDEQMPCVGIFWYDPEDHTLFGVRKKELTPREVEDAAEKGKPFIIVSDLPVAELKRGFPKLYSDVILLE